MFSIKIFLRKTSLLACFFLFGTAGLFAQAGITASPIKFYYNLPLGGSESQQIVVTNPTDIEIEVGVSYKDWKYSQKGNNQIVDAGSLPTSCSNWIKVLPASYFVLQPHETKVLDIVFTVPPDADTSIPVHTALLFFTQLNPTAGGVDKNGAAIRVTVQMGVKVYHSFSQVSQPEMEITDFGTFDNNAPQKSIYLVMENRGNIWTDGNIAWELFNQNTGKKKSLKKIDFYTLPGDSRRVEMALPSELPKGKYTLTAIVSYGESDVIKVAELSFTL